MLHDFLIYWHMVLQDSALIENILSFSIKKLPKPWWEGYWPSTHV